MGAVIVTMAVYQVFPVLSCFLFFVCFLFSSFCKYDQIALEFGPTGDLSNLSGNNEKQGLLLTWDGHMIWERFCCSEPLCLLTQHKHTHLDWFGDYISTSPKCITNKSLPVFSLFCMQSSEGWLLLVYGYYKKERERFHLTIYTTC